MKPDPSNINYQLSTIPPLVVVVGPTASGKSNTAMVLAREFNGEIICADSRTVYKGMDIGTAKPSKQDQQEIRHHLLDIITPDQTFTAAEFKNRALEAIEDISSRGKLPIIAGGTGLYVDGVIFDFAFLPPAPTPDRERLQQLSVEELQEELNSKGIALPENSKNPRHLIRAIETNGAVAVKKGLRENTLVLGMDALKNVIAGRIKKRVDVMVEDGFVDELENLVKRYGWDAPGLQSTGYKAFHEYIENKVSMDEAKAQFALNDMHLAKRQRTWLKRNEHIKWVKNSAEAEVLLKYFLQQSPSK